MNNNTSITLRQIKNIVDSMCPIKIYIDHKGVWDDEYNTLAQYDQLFNCDDLVTSIRFDIVMFHHSIVYITTRF